ncbi:MAG: transcriptional repressor [Polyangiales bacterium]
MRAATRLNRSGLKATTPRMVVLDIFETSPRRHLTADDVVRCLDERKIDLGLPTVYRVLAQLTEVGLLTRSMFDWERASYELRATNPHGHLVCVDCGTIEEFTDEQILARERSAATERGFEISERHEVLYGRCARCCAKAKDKSHCS